MRDVEARAAVVGRVSADKAVFTRSLVAMDGDAIADVRGREHARVSWGGSGLLCGDHVRRIMRYRRCVSQSISCSALHSLIH